jgi:hypothetical protein
MLNQKTLEGNEKLMYDYIKECDSVSIDTGYITWFAKTNYFRDLYPGTEHLTHDQYNAIEHMFDKIYALYLEDKMFPH